MTKRGIGIKAGDQSTLIEMLGSKLPWWMQYRELLKNSEEAIVATGRQGAIFVFADDDDKAVIVDTGIGMTRSTAVKHLNTTLSSGTSASAGLGRNHGLGSKITARHRNPYSLIYLTYRDGEATKIVMRKRGGSYVIDSTDADGTDGASKVDPTELDRRIIKAGHGTQVILGGSSKGDRTARLLPDVASHISDRIWVRHPKLRNFTITTLDGDKIELSGVRDRLISTATQTGTVELDGAAAHWFIFDAADGMNTGVVSQAEVYHPASGRDAASVLSRCGIHDGAQRVSVFFEPDPERFVPNAERDSLMQVGGGAKMTTWIGRWAEQFRNNMPAEIIALIAEETERALDGVVGFDPSRVTSFRRFFQSGKRRAPRSGSKPRDRRPDHKTAARVAAVLPTVQWGSSIELGGDFFDGEAAVFDKDRFTIWVDSDYGPTRSLVDLIVASLPEDRVDLHWFAEAKIRERMSEIAADAFLGARIVAANCSKTTSEVFNTSVSTALAMRATALVPHVQDELRARRADI